MGGSAANSSDESILIAGESDSFRFTREWSTVSGVAIHEKLGLQPLDLPGVRALPQGASRWKPWPYRVHRTHLPLLGIEPPPLVSTKGAPELLRPYQVDAWRFIRSRRGTLLADEMRCVSGDAVVSYNRAGRTRRTSLSVFYDRFHSSWNLAIPTLIRSLCGGFFRLNRVLDVVDNGMQSTIRVTLASGKAITLTPDHAVAVSLTDFTPAGNLRVGQAILVNGQAVCRECGRSDRRIVTYKYSLNIGRCVGCVQREVNLTGRHPNATGKHLATDGYVRVSGLRGHARADSNGYVREHILVAEEMLGRPLREEEVVHHKDRDRTNNDPSNLEVTTDSVHQRQHGLEGNFANLDGGATRNGGVVHFVPKEDRIVSIAPCGLQRVYDVVCADPHRNFVANGIVVHNCGKTLPTLYSHDDEDAPLFVIGPLAARSVWHEWTARRWGGCYRLQSLKRCSICDRVKAPILERPSFMVLEGRKFDVEALLKYRPRVLFCTYAVASTWRSLFSQIPRIGTLVFDEIHLSGVQNRKNITVESMRWLNTIADRTVALSGTPLFNRVQGLWPILDLVNPAAFGDYWTFARRYCGARPTAHGWTAMGETHQEELRLRLSEVMLRRRWVDVQGDLPPISRSMELIPLPQEVKDRVVETAGRIRYETRKPKTFVGDLARLRKLFAREKLEGALGIVKQVLADNHSCVAWTWHRETAVTAVERLQAAGIPVYGPITGETTGDRRDSVLAGAAAEPRPRVLVASIAALATAVSLNWASHEVFIELSWNPSDIAQAEMRPYDGKNHVAAIYCAADVDVDERLAHALIHKLNAQDRLGLRAGVGDVADILSDSLGVERDRSLDDLAALILETAREWV